MFLYLVALVATLFLIFGLAYGRPSNDSLRSTIHYPLSLYRDFNYGPTSVGRGNDSESRRSFAEISEAGAYETPVCEIQEILANNAENLAGETMKDGGRRNLGPLSYSLENFVQNEKEKDRNLPASRILQHVGTSGAMKAAKQEGSKENALHTLKSSVQKTAATPSPKLTTSQIYNLILKETLKEHKLMVDDKNEPDGSSNAMKADQLDAALYANEGKSEREENARRSMGLREDKTS